MSSNIEIRRTCAWCKQEFIAHKTTTTCCSHRCANLLYKQKKREASIKANNQVVEKVIKEKPIAKIRDKPILTITEAATYIGVTRPTLYGYLKRGELKATRLGYKFLLKKEDIDNFSFIDFESFEQKRLFCDMLHMEAANSMRISGSQILGLL